VTAVTRDLFTSKLFVRLCSSGRQQKGHSNLPTLRICTTNILSAVGRQQKGHSNLPTLRICTIYTSQQLMPLEQQPEQKEHICVHQLPAKCPQNFVEAISACAAATLCCSTEWIRRVMAEPVRPVQHKNHSAMTRAGARLSQRSPANGLWGHMEVLSMSASSAAKNLNALQCEWERGFAQPPRSVQQAFSHGR
jgi:hypothetical protein